MVFADDDNAIDTKSHFEYIESKIDFNAENFVHAVEDAIAIKLNGGEKKQESPKKTEELVKSAPVVEPDDLDDDDEAPFDLETAMEEVIDEISEAYFDAEEARTEIRNKNKIQTKKPQVQTCGWGDGLLNSLTDNSE
jgi:hypothetical protein